MDEFLGSEEEDRVFAVCIVMVCIVFYGTFIMMFLVGIIQLLLGM